MTTTAGTLQIVPESPPSAPGLRAADRGVAFRPGVRPLPKTPGGSTAPSGASSKAGAIRWTCAPCRRSPSPSPATWRCGPVRAPPSPPCAWPPPPSPRYTNGPGHDSPGRDRGVREALKGWGRRLAKPQRQAGALTADVLAVIRLTAPKPRARGRSLETAEQAAQRARFDLALVAVLSRRGGCVAARRRPLTWGDVQRWDDGSGRITVIRSKTYAEAPAPWWLSPPPP